MQNKKTIKMTAVLPQQKPNPGEGTYTYSSQPRAAPQRKKFRNDTDQAPIDPCVY